MVAIVVPAHNEERSLPRLLRALAGLGADVAVVANGCTDATAEVARSFPGVRVLETPVPSKTAALALGDRHVPGYPRLYVDADVVLGADDVRALCAALSADGVHAAGPVRVIPMDGASWAVRQFYEVWQRLPGVRHELYGRGAVAVDEEGHRRLAGWPHVMSDDLMIAMAFEAHERVVVPGARVVIRPPRTYADLLRRRTRAMTGNRALTQNRALAGTRTRRAGGSEAHRPPAAVSSRRAGGATLTVLGRLVRQDPRLAPAVAVFLATGAVAKLRGRRAAARGDTAWLRDESSRLA